MPDALVTAVEPHCVDAVQPLHPARQVGLRRLHEEMEVVVEQVPGVHLPAEAPADVEQQLEPRLAVTVVEHDRSLLDPAADHVVPGGARQRTARHPGHDREQVAGPGNPCDPCRQTDVIGDLVVASADRALTALAGLGNVERPVRAEREPARVGKSRRNDLEVGSLSARQVWCRC